MKKINFFPSSVCLPKNCDQDDTLTGDLSSVDIATKKNLENLVQVGEKLLKKPVSRVNLQSGVFEPLNQGTNEDALKKYERIVSTLTAS